MDFSLLLIGSVFDKASPADVSANACQRRLADPLYHAAEWCA
jgi:hypothetical protein